MDKAKFLKDFAKALENNCTKMVVAVQLNTGAVELIINNEYLHSKMNYYDEAYNDKLELKNYIKIKIVNYMFC